MCSRSNAKKAQSVTEYSIGIAAVLLAMLAMSTYARRGLQGRYADVVKAAQKSADSTQYEPYYADSEAKVDFSSIATVDIDKGAKSSKIFNEKVNYKAEKSEKIGTDDE